MFNDYDGMRAMTKEEMAERAKREYRGMQAISEKEMAERVKSQYQYYGQQNAWLREDQRKLMKTYMNGYFHELEKTREKLERKPKPTLWQRFKSWIKE